MTESDLATEGSRSAVRKVSRATLATGLGRSMWQRPFDEELGIAEQVSGSSRASPVE